MKKIISAVMICLFLGSSVHAQTQFSSKIPDRIASVAGLYARALQFYCHAAKERNAGTIRSEAEPLLKDIFLELSRPEYRPAALQLRSALLDRGQDDLAELFDLIIGIGNRNADPEKMNSCFKGQNALGILSDCASYPTWMVTVLINALSNFPSSGLFYGVVSLLFAFAVNAVLLVLWPLCLIGISAGEAFGFILCPILGVCPP